MGQYCKKEISLQLIQAAIGGDVDALEAVIEYYHNYIAHIATYEHCDDCGSTYWAVNEELSHRLKTKLVTAVMKFRIPNAT